MAGFTISPRMGQLASGPNMLQNPCCKAVGADLAALLQYGDLRQADDIVDGQPGFATNPVRFGGMTHTVNLVLLGDVDQDGRAYDDQVDGFIANFYGWLRPTWGDPTGVGDGTRTLTLTIGSTTFTATGRTGPARLGSLIGDGSMTATLDVYLPFGPFVKVP